MTPFLTVVTTFAASVLPGAFIIKRYKNRIVRESEESVKNKHQIELIKAVLDQQECERKRMASDIHDSLSCILSTAKINLDLSLQTILPASSQDLIIKSKGLLDEAIESSRRIARNLTPAVIETLGLSEAVNDLCTRIRKSDLKVQFAEYGRIENMPSDKAVQIYRIIQEIVNNYLKHSGGTIISIEMYWGPLLSICIIDNGRPFEYPVDIKSQSGLGLLNIRNRLEILDATLQSEAGNPNKTHIVIPLKSAVKTL